MGVQPTFDRSIKVLRSEIAEAPDPQILRIVATVDLMAERGTADGLIAPLRQRLSMLRPPRPLRFARLLFRPLDPLIVPAGRWRPGEDSIPRAALAALADHARRAMAGPAAAIEGETAGHTDAETDLVCRLGHSLWPAAARTFRSDTVPPIWDTCGLSITVYRPLANCIAALLDEAASLEAICAGTANGLCPVDAGLVMRMLDHVAAADQTALPMLIALLLIRLPEAAETVLRMAGGSNAALLRVAMDQAVERVLKQLNLDGGTEDLIASGTLADAGTAASHVKTLLAHLDGPLSKPRWREPLRTIRQRLDASCKARFTAGLESELLSPLQRLQASPGHVAMRGLETAARNLRVLEMEARAVGSGAAYDLLLRRATEAINGAAAGSHLPAVDRMRLVELLSGPEAALAMLNATG